MSFQRRIVALIFVSLTAICISSCAHLLPYSESGNVKSVIVSEIKQDICKSRPKQLPPIISSKTFQAVAKYPQAINCHGFSFYEVYNSKLNKTYNLYHRTSSDKECIRQIAVPITHSCNSLAANDCPELNQIRNELSEFLEEALSIKSKNVKSDLYDYTSFEKWCRKRVRQNMYL